MIASIHAGPENNVRVSSASMIESMLDEIITFVSLVQAGCQYA